MTANKQNLPSIHPSIKPIILTASVLSATLSGCSGTKWSKPGTWFTRNSTADELPTANTSRPLPTQNSTLARSFTPAKTTGKPNSLHLELYAERVGLEEANFERYVAKDSVMIVECGERKRDQPEIQWQQTVVLADSDRALLSQLAEEISPSSVSQLPKPETNGTLFDAGTFELYLSSGKNRVASPLQIATTLDVVSNQRTNPTRKLNSLFARLRGVSSKAPCGNLTFFGIGRKETLAKG